MKYVLLIIFTLFSLTVSAAPRDVVFSWENPPENANFPPLLATLYERSDTTPVIVIADNLTGNEYASHLSGEVGRRTFYVTYFYIDETGTRQESDASNDVSVTFRPYPPSARVR